MSKEKSFWLKEYNILNYKVMIILILVFLFYMLYYHLPVFSCLYLTEQRKQDIENFSEKMLGVFEKRIAIHRADPLWRFPSENKKTLESIKEVIRFIQKNNFDIINIYSEIGLVRYVHGFLGFFVVEYWYRKEADFQDKGNSTDTVRTKAKPKISVHFPTLTAVFKKGNKFRRNNDTP